MDVHPDVFPADQQRLAGVNGHADTHTHAVRPGRNGKGPLSILSSRGRIGRAAERHEERVAGRVDLVPGMPIEHLAQQPVVLLEDIGVTLRSEPPE